MIFFHSKFCGFQRFFFIFPLIFSMAKILTSYFCIFLSRFKFYIKNQPEKWYNMPILFACKIHFLCPRNLTKSLKRVIGKSDGNPLPSRTSNRISRKPLTIDPGILYTVGKQTKFPTKKRIRGTKLRIKPVTPRALI